MSNFSFNKLLFLSLRESISYFESKNKKEEQNIDELIDIFINEKIEKCKQEIKENQNNISKNIIEKKKLNGKLLKEVKNYNEIFITKFNQFISNLNELLKIFNEGKENDKNKSEIQMIQEIFDELNKFNIYKANIGKINNNEIINIEELKEIINKYKNSIKYKKEMIINIIPKIIESYNLIINEEIKVDNEIKYYDYKKQLLIDKKSTNEDLDSFINEYKNIKNEILSLKEKFNKLKEDFILAKEKLIYNENILINQIEKELENIIYIESEEEKNNINLNYSTEETNDEEEEDNQKIISEINILKNNILKNKDILLKNIENEEDKNINNFYNKCKNENLIFTEKEKRINILISSRNDIEKNLDDFKLNFLILNTLPNQYQSYKMYINHDSLIDKNKKLEQKLKLVFGNNFNVNYIYNDSKPEIIWRQEEIPQLKSEIMILREEKNKLESDFNALKMAFDLALKGNGGDNQLLILFKIKEENKKLKKEIQQIKEKNSKLEEKLKELNYNNLEILNTNGKNLKINDFIGINNSLNGNSILSINDIGNNHYGDNHTINNINNNHNNSKIIKEYKKPNIKQKILFSEGKINSSFLNGSKEYCSEYKSKSKKKFSNIGK